MTVDDLKNHILARIEEIKATSPESDEAEMYLQGCQEELERLLKRMNPHFTLNPPMWINQPPPYIKIK